MLSELRMTRIPELLKDGDDIGAVDSSDLRGFHNHQFRPSHSYRTHLQAIHVPLQSDELMVEIVERLGNQVSDLDSGSMLPMNGGLSSKAHVVAHKDREAHC